MTTINFEATLNPNKPRRIARFVAYVVSICAGLFYVFYPPTTTINFLDSPTPARLWGAFFVLGGVTSGWAWIRRTLILDRIGLTMIMTGLISLIVSQTALFLNGPTLTRGGGTLVLVLLFCSLLARWQDVKHDEKLSEEVFDYEEKVKPRYGDKR